MKNLNKYISFFVSIVFFSLMVGCASGPKHEGTGEYVDDSVITTKVKAAILDDEVLKVSEINVETFKGIVQLSGFVANSGDIDRATSVAESVSGVKSVKNDIRTK